ncbi:suppressor of fused domain protein [Streptomyces sp. NPDC005969]|uniref:suppressor of fused domain protein n=1 Tax=Streptomyces sp. NPDC005969 TaxID=3156722 RepID=UPI0033F0BD85
MPSSPSDSLPDQDGKGSPENGTHVSVVWLVPLHGTEAQYVARNGWPACESELTRQDPDLFDLERPSMNL